MIEETLNKALDYTRGNNTYLQCVNNNLEHAALAVINMESGLRGEIQDLRSDFQTAAVGLYNQGQEIRNDIQASTAMNINAIQGMAMGITSDIRESTYAVVASQQMLANTFNQGFSSVNNTINLGFGLVGNKIDVLSEEVSSKLDEIQDILNNPRLTQSRELYREALRSYKRGFYEEALEDCLGAIEKNKTDYISWYLLGLIYLYGAGENSNVINLDKAEEAFTNAAKYIKPDIAKSDEAKLFASDIYYNLGFSRLAKSNDYLIENKVDDSNTKLLEAEEASRTSYQLSKENLLARYEHAKSLHFLGKDDEVLKILEELIRKEKNFAIKSINDENFKSLWSCIEKLIEKLKLEVCNQIKNKIKETIDFYENKLKANDEIANYELPRNYRTSNIEVFQKKQNELKLRHADIENKDYFTVLNLKKQLSGDLDNFSNEISNLIHDTKTAIEQKLAEERRIQQEEREREQAELRRQREERERQEREERRRKEKEEERIREEQRRQEEEKKRLEKKRLEKKEEGLWCRKRSILLLLFIGFQCGLIMCAKYLDVSWIKDMERYINNELSTKFQFLPILAGLFSFIGLLFAGGTRLFGIFVLSVSTVLSFVLGHPIIGLINISSFMLLFARKNNYSNFGAMGICVILLAGYGIFSYMFSDKRQTNLLLDAINDNNIKKAERCIEKGADVNAEKGFDNLLKTAIYRTMREGYNLEMVKLLIKNGADVNVYADYRTLLSWVVDAYTHKVVDHHRVKYECIEILLEAGADPNMPDKYSTTNNRLILKPLNYARKDSKVRNLLISYGAKE